MSVSVKFNDLPRATNGAVSYLDAILRREGFNIERDMKKSMSGTKHGQLYGKHRASAPGEPPARDTGELVNSIHTETGLQPHTVYVLIDAEYAAHLEYGTVKMQPRPFVIPATEKARVRLSRVKIPAAALRGASALQVTGPPSV